MGPWLCLALATAQVSAPTAPSPRPDLVVYASDEAGALLVDGWRIRIGAWSGTTIRWDTEAAVDPATGSAAFARLAGATCIVEAIHATGETSGREQIALAPEGGTVHEVVFHGPRPERALIVDLSPYLGIPLSPTPDTALFAVDAVGRELPLGPHPTIARRYVAHDVPSGTYRVETRDPRFASRVLDAIVPGVPARATPTGSASLIVRFVDADGGTPLWPATCTLLEEIEARDYSSSTSRGPFAPQKSRASGREGVSTSVLPGTRVTLGAVFAEHHDAMVRVDSLQPQESRVLEWPVQRARVVAGQVVDPTGQPVAGVSLVSELDPRDLTRNTRHRSGRLLALSTGAIGAVSSQPGSSISAQRVVLLPSVLTPVAAQSGDSGAFRLVKVPAELQRVYAVLSPWHHVTVPLDGEAPLRVTTLGPGAADVQLTVPGDVDLAKLSFALQVGDGPWLVQRSAPLLDDASCLRLRGMPLAPCRLWVTHPTPGPPAAPSPYDEVLEFTPRAGAPTRATLDLTRLARWR